MPQVALPRPAARALDAVKRRGFEQQMKRGIAVDLQVPSTRHGSEWGGWMVPDGIIGPGSICYCVGAGGDISFDLAMLQAGAKVRCVDPSPVFGEEARRAAGDDHRFTFTEAALAAADGTLTMYRSFDPQSRTASAENIYRTSASFEVRAASLATLMREAGDEHIDLLKIDIEGSEYEVLEALDPAALGIKVLCVEFHHTSSAARARRALARHAGDFGISHVSGRSDVTLMRRSAVPADLAAS